MKKALLIIDYTNDFIADNGSLTCGKPAQALEDYLIELANKFYDNGDYVIFQLMDIPVIHLVRNINSSHHIILLVHQDKSYTVS